MRKKKQSVEKRIGIDSFAQAKEKVIAVRFTNEKVVSVKIFFVFILLAVLNVGIVILMDIIQSIPLYDTVGVLKLPLWLIRGEEGVLLFLFIPLVIVCHRRIMKNGSKKTG